MLPQGDMKEYVTSPEFAVGVQGCGAANFKRNS